MSAGQNAADEAKGVLKGINQIGEDARNQVNSFADNLLGGNKTHKSTGFSEDAKALGNSVDQAATNANTKSQTTETRTL